MNLERAKRVIGEAYQSSLLVPESPVEANRLIEGYYEGRLALPAKDGDLPVLLMALEVLKCSCMAQSHDGDPKRADRRQGEKRRKARTGSRRG